MQSCMSIRNKVFVEGQNVSLSEEQDGKDSDSDHFILLVDNNPAGTCRVRYIESLAKIERVAILAQYRGLKLGNALMQVILEDLKKTASVKKAILSSQVYVIPFYEKFGFKICSEEYMDAGIPHQDMELIL